MHPWTMSSGSRLYIYLVFFPSSILYVGSVATLTLDWTATEYFLSVFVDIITDV